MEESKMAGMSIFFTPQGIAVVAFFAWRISGLCALPLFFVEVSAAMMVAFTMPRVDTYGS
jgi:hypothetical protein